MAQLLVRRIDDDTKRRLKERARRHGVSMEQEARTILVNAVLEDDRGDHGLGQRFMELFGDIDWGDGELERFPSSPARPASFD